MAKIAHDYRRKYPLGAREEVANDLKKLASKCYQLRIIISWIMGKKV